MNGIVCSSLWAKKKPLTILKLRRTTSYTTFIVWMEIQLYCCQRQTETEQKEQSLSVVAFTISSHTTNDYIILNNFRPKCIYVAPKKMCCTHQPFASHRISSDSIDVKSRWICDWGTKSKSINFIKSTNILVGSIWFYSLYLCV